MQTERDARVTSRLIDRISRVDLRVRDIDRAITFYRDVVGLRVLEQREARADLGADDGSVLLSLTAEGVRAPADPRATGLFHTAFRFPTRAGLGDALGRVVRMGIELGAGDHLVSEALYIDDPDGNGVELYWDRPVEQWPAPTDDALVPMATLAVDLDDLLRAGHVAEPDPGPPDVGHVHLQVRDVEETVSFYVDVLALDLTARMGSSAAFFSSNGYHHHIGANAWRSSGGAPAPKERAGLERVTFAVGSAEDLERLRERAAGSVVADAVTDEVVVIDPNGIELRFSLA